MPLFRFPKPNADAPFLAGRIAAWLENHGYQLGPDGVTVTNTDVLVDADRDPTADITAYQPTELPEERTGNAARVELAAAIDLIRDKAPVTRSPAERAILALVVLVRDRGDE